MTYLVNEIFYSIQGEGYWTGRPAVFVRFSRCNLACEWCDTDFADAERMALDDVLGRVAALWPVGFPSDEAMAIFTGGEPALQLDTALLSAVKDMGFYTAIETNGTRRLPGGIDWICVSPKHGAECVVGSGNELKVVWPQALSLDHIKAATDFQHYWLSPMDGPNLAANTAAALEYVLAHPQWRLNIQTHKVIGAR